MYSSDIGKMIGCPVLHVNGDNPEVLYATCGKIFSSELEGQYLTPGHAVDDPGGRGDSHVKLSGVPEEIIQKYRRQARFKGHLFRVK